MRTIKKRLSLEKKTFSAALILGLAFAIICPLFPETITLIHSNDTHGTFKPYKITVKGKDRWIGGMEAASHYINKIRSMEKNVLLVDTGDLMTGTLAAEIEYQGVTGGAMIEFLNSLGYDLWCYGNHDFDKGKRNALRLAGLAKFPTIMANIVYKENGRLFSEKPYHIFDIAGLKVGIIAVMEENFLTEVLKENVEGLEVLPMVPLLNSFVPVLDKQTDLIVAVVHSRFVDGERVAENVPGIDVVLVASEDGKFKEANRVLVKSTVGHQQTLGYLKLEVENDKVKAYQEKLIWLWADTDLKPSPQVTALVKEIEASARKEFTKVIGEAKLDLTRKGNPVENVMGNWITDAMRWKTGAQIGLQNSGGIRADIETGPITKAEVFEVFPFNDTLVVFRLNGQQIKDVFERDVERGWDRLQVSGLKYKYYPKEAKPFGERVDSIEINGEVLEKEGKVLQPKKVYTIVSNAYLVGHSTDKYFGFPVIDLRDTEFPLNQVLIEWLEKHKDLGYKSEDRIVEIIK